jgi:Uma2 family endonuclease
MATALNVRLGSLTDFVAWEHQQPERYERVDGIVRMMTGGTIDHNRIALNVADALRQQLRGGNCETFVSDIKIVSPEEDVMYPDVVVVGGEIPGKATELETPVVVVEVLPQSTTARDHGPKRWSNQTIRSVRHYLLIDQNKPRVEVASRHDDGSWRSVVHRGLDARLRLDALGVELGLDEIFTRVTFAPAPSGEPSEVPQRSG